MKNVKLIVAVFVFICCAFCSVFAQNAATNSGGQVNQTQPSVITVPYKKDGQHYRSLINDPVNGNITRTALNTVDQALKARGFATNDFVGTLDKIKTMDAYSNGVQVDEQTAITEGSAADIYITVDAQVLKSNSGTQVTVSLVALQCATGLKLSTSLRGESYRLYTDDIGKLMIQAVDAIKEDFLNELQRTFTDIVNNGQQVGIQFSLVPNCPINFSSEVGNDGDLLSEAISDWLGKNAYKNYAKPSGGNSIQLGYDIKLPLKDQSTGLNYLPKENFGRLIRKFLKDLKIEAEVACPKPGQLLVTIKGTKTN